MFKKSVISVATLFALAQPGIATEPAPKDQSPNIHKGDILLTGSVGLGYGSTTGLFGTLEPRVEYFVLDRLSLGGFVGIDTSFDSVDTWVTVGPSASYYFWNSEKLATYTSVRYDFTRYFGTNSNTGFLKLDLGANYFFSKNLGVGPRLTLSKRINGMDGTSGPNLNVTLINVFLYF